jgi:hypothetical protein
VVAEKWRELSPTEKDYFNKKAEDDRGRHDREVEVWNNHIQNNPVP